jgi:hypothetical protein
MFFVLVLLYSSDNIFAYEPIEGHITATFGTNFNKTNFSDDISSKINSAYLRGFGLIVVGDINQKGALEIGTFYMPHQYFREQETQQIVERIQELHISMGYRRFINSSFSTSLSFYSSYSMGDPQVIYTNFSNGPEINTSARDITEYGLDWAVQAELWNYNKFAIVFEGRYSLSLTHKINEKSDQYGFLLGIRYLIQEEKKIESRH